MAITTAIRDWTYRGAQLRLHRAGQANLPRHIASVRLDWAGNRVIECRCGWTGNGLGWVSHVDDVVRGALRD